MRNRYFTSFGVELEGGDPGRSWIDIECYKVPIEKFPKDWPAGAGKNRFRAFMIGIAYYNRINN